MQRSASRFASWLTWAAPTESRLPTTGQKLVLSAGILTYVLACTLVYDKVLGGDRHLFQMANGFGPIVENLVLHDRYVSHPDPFPFTAHRMPLIPYFSAALGKIQDSLLLALLAKNLLCGVLLCAACIRLWNYCAKLPWLLLLGLLAFGLAIPKMPYFNTLIDFEEGWLISMSLLLFVYLLTCERGSDGRLLSAPTPAQWVTLFATNAAMVLTKASTLPLAIFFCLLFYNATRKPRIALGFVAFLVAALLFWAGHNFTNSSRFTTMSSWNGVNFFKGNNPRTGEIYPWYTLDELQAQVPPRGQKTIRPPPGVHDEWQYQDYYMGYGMAFVRSEPGEVLRLMLVKAYVLLVEFRIVPYLERRAKWLEPVEQVNRVFMLVFRLVFFSSLAYALWWSLQMRNRRTRPGNQMRLAIGAFLGFVIGYSAAPVVGFAYQRHTMPLILPTLAFAAVVIHLSRGQTEEGATG